MGLLDFLLDILLSLYEHGFGEFCLVDLYGCFLWNFIRFFLVFKQNARTRNNALAVNVQHGNKGQFFIFKDQDGTIRLIKGDSCR